jgi:glycosyltransferase involved in cell wall biosynthesis
MQHCIVPGRPPAAGLIFRDCIGLTFVHIAFWSPAWPLEKYQNGIITYVHWMKRELERRGHRVSVFTETLDEDAAEPRVYKVRRSLLDRLLRRLRGRREPSAHDIFTFSAVIARAMTRVHRQDPIDVLEMEESFGWFADIQRRTSLPTLVKLHGPAFMQKAIAEIETPGVAEQIEREGRALRCADVLLAPSQFTLTRTLEHYGLEPARHGIALNPMVMDADTPLWRLDACERNTVLFVGRFDLVKGADIVLQAFRSALARRPDLKLIFVGPDRGLVGRGGRTTHFAAYCESLLGPEARARVDFRGRMTNREIARLRTQAMVTVLASRMENQSYALLEAMYQGCPVVSTDAGGCPESVLHGRTGRLAKSADPEAFAAQILAMIEDPERAREMGEAARRHVLEEHAPARVAAAMLEWYGQAIAIAGYSRPAG